MSTTTPTTPFPPMLPGRRAAHIAVLDAHSLHLSDGRSFPRARQFASVAELAHAARTLGMDQLWLTVDALPGAGGVGDLDWSAEALGRWDIGPRHTSAPDSRTFWLHCFERGSANRHAVDLVFCANDEKGLFHEVRDGGMLVRALTLYQRLLGMPLRWSPGATGTRLLADLHDVPHGLTIEAPAPPPPPALEPGTETALDWCRALTPTERRRAYLHVYDKNGQYLAAASSLRLGVGPWQHVRAGDKPGPGMETHFARPGYWRVHVDERPRSALEASLPPPYRRPRPGSGSSLTWVTTPTLTLLRECDWCDVAVTEGYIWPDHHRPLEPWYKRLRNARTHLLEMGDRDYDVSPHVALALALVKMTYAHTSGYLAYPGRSEQLRTEHPLYRPDWRHAWVAQARANLYRRVVQCAAWDRLPVAIGKDALFFVSDDGNATRGCPDTLLLDDSLAGWKVAHAAVPLGEALAVMDASGPNYLRELQIWLNCRADGRAYQAPRTRRARLAGVRS